MPAKLGQHFLIEDEFLTKLAVAACGDHTPRVIEIGPGRGGLTRYLLRRTDELHAVELDTSLVAYLKRNFPNEPKLHVHHSDVLAIDLSQWGAGVVTGNLPYYITSPIVEKFLDLDERFEAAVFLMQWEVAQRLVSGPGTRDYGYLTVATQLVCDVELVCRIPPSAFAPPPKVDSGAVRLRRKVNRPAHLPQILEFASRCFTHKRKTLRNNLRPFYGAAIDALPEANLRAEQLDLEHFIQLHAMLSRQQTNDTTSVN